MKFIQALRPVGGIWAPRDRATAVFSGLIFGSLFALACGASSNGPIDLDGGSGFRMPEGSFVEANMTMAAGSTVTAVWESTDAVVDWNVHSHPTAGFITHDQGSGTNGTIVFVAPAPGPYSIMWERARANTDLILDMQFDGDISVEWVAP